LGPASAGAYAEKTLALWAIVLGAGRKLLEYADVVIGAPGKRAKIAFLALAALIVDAATCPN
jgi:hypothetical protein